MLSIAYFYPNGTKLSCQDDTARCLVFNFKMNERRNDAGSCRGGGTFSLTFGRILYVSVPWSSEKNTIPFRIPLFWIVFQCLHQDFDLYP